MFCTLKSAPSWELVKAAVVCVKEPEGLTLVLPKQEADKHDKLTYDYVSGWITLDVQSNLSAVGLTAAVSNVLARNGISCNVVAGYYHDHIFVKHDETQRAAETIAVLNETFERN